MCAAPGVAARVGGLRVLARAVRGRAGRRHGAVAAHQQQPALRLHAAAGPRRRRRRGRALRQRRVRRQDARARRRPRGGRRRARRRPALGGGAHPGQRAARAGLGRGAAQHQV